MGWFFDDDDDECEHADSETEDDAEEEAEAEEDDGLAVEDEAGLARLDRAFRALRGRVRACSDVSELRTWRAEQAAALAGRLTPTVRLRTLDIIEAIDDRVTDLRALRAGRRSA